MRKAPAWFVQKLQNIHRCLYVRWNDKRNQWEIGEYVPWNFKKGALNDGRQLVEVRQRQQRIFWIDDLGTGALDLVRRQQMNRFKTVEDMVNGLDIDKSETSMAEALA